MITLVAAAWAAVSGAAGAAWRTVAASKPLQFILAVVAAVVGIGTAIEITKRAGARQERRKIMDKIEEETRDAVRKIETETRKLERDIGPPPEYTERRPGGGLESDSLNDAQLRRLQQRAKTDPYNRRNPREDPGGDV